MKKIIFTVIVLSLIYFVTPINAQNAIGIFGGVNYSNLYTDNSNVSLTGRKLFTLGGVIQLKGLGFSNLLLQPSYILHGAYEVEDRWSGNYSLSYINLPIFL